MLKKNLLFHEQKIDSKKKTKKIQVLLDILKEIHCFFFFFQITRENTKKILENEQATGMQCTEYSYTSHPKDITGLRKLLNNIYT